MKAIGTKSEKQTATIKLLSVRVVDGAWGSGVHADNSSPYVNSEFVAKRLMLRFRHDGKMKIVYTPQVTIIKNSGFINSESIWKGNDWFCQSEGESKGHKVELYSGKGPSVYIENTSKVIPAVKVGDEITISYKNKDNRMTYLKKL